MDEKEEEQKAVTYRRLQQQRWIAGLEQHQLCPAARAAARADDATDSQTGFWKMRN